MELGFIGGGVAAPKGFTANGIHCGIRKNKEKKDLALIYCEKDCDAAAVYTQNLVCGAALYADFLSAYYGRARSANLLQQSKEAELLCLQCWLLREISDAPAVLLLPVWFRETLTIISILVFCRQLSSRRLCFYAYC